WSADAKVLVYRGSKEFIFWNSLTGQTRSLLLKDGAGLLGSAWDLSPDGRWLVVGMGEKGSCWDTASGNLVGRPGLWPKGPGSMSSLEFSPDGQLLLSRFGGGLRLLAAAALRDEAIKPVNVSGGGAPVHAFTWARWAPDSKSFVAQFGNS